MTFSGAVFLGALRVNSVNPVVILKIGSWSAKYNQKQGIAGNTNSLAQDYLVWANTDLGNFMTHSSYMNEETKSHI